MKPVCIGFHNPESGEPPSQELRVLAGPGSVGSGDLLDPCRQRGGVGRRAQRRDGNAENAPGPWHGLSPFGRVGRRLLHEHAGVVEPGDRALRRSALDGERHAALGCIEQDDQVLGLAGQARFLWVIDPVPEFLDGDVAAVHPAVPGEVFHPVAADHEVGAVVRHLADQERIGHLLEQPTIVAADFGPAI